jgi:multiple sugar transport system ATP-binding protein
MELYNDPANVFVAGFIGSPQMNLLDAGRVGMTGAATVGIRPEHIAVGTESGEWKGALVHLEQLGADTNLYVETERAGLVTVRLFGEVHHDPGETLYLTPDPARLYRFDAEGRVIR